MDQSKVVPGCWDFFVVVSFSFLTGLFWALEGFSLSLLSGAVHVISEAATRCLPMPNPVGCDSVAQLASECHPIKQWCKGFCQEGVAIKKLNVECDIIELSVISYCIPIHLLQYSSLLVHDWQDFLWKCLREENIPHWIEWRKARRTSAPKFFSVLKLWPEQKGE